MKRSVAVVVTARPSYCRIKTALKAIGQHPNLDLKLIVGASALLERYGNILSIIEQDGFEIAARVYMVLEGENPTTMAKTTGLGLMELATTLDNIKPDIVVTVADRYETISTAIAAAYMNIPVGHVQGGEITGSVDEKVRHAVTKLSNIHFAATNLSAERIIRMGERPGTVHITGCPSIDIAAQIVNNPELDFDPYQKYGGVGKKIDITQGYVVVLQHPVTTECNESRTHVAETLYAMHDIGLPVLWFWPNVDAGSDGTSKGIRWFREEKNPKNLRFFKNMEPEDFLRLLYNCKCVVGNSSVAIRECSYMGIPAVNIGSRQNGRERGANVIDVAYDRNQIRSATLAHLGHGRYAQDTTYGDGKAGERIADLLAATSLNVEKCLDY